MAEEEEPAEGEEVVEKEEPEERGGCRGRGGRGREIDRRMEDRTIGVGESGSSNDERSGRRVLGEQVKERRRRGNGRRRGRGSTRENGIGRKKNTRRESRVDIDWQEVNPERDTEQNTFTFSEHSGPKLALGRDAKHIEFFQHFLGDNFIDMIVSVTNTYAAQKISEYRRTNRLTRGSRWHK